MEHHLKVRSTSLPGFLFLLLLLVPLSPPEALDAQVRSIAWDETTRFEIPGTLGALLRAMPGSSMAGSESRQAVHLEGSVLRQDDGHTSTVIDLDRREILSIDHDSRSYMRFTFAEASQMALDMNELLAEAMMEMEEDEEYREAMAQQEEAMEEMQRQMEESTVEMEFRIQSEATGETENLAEGITASRYFVTAELEVTDEIEGADSREGGILTILVELWQSTDFPDAEALYEEWAHQLAEDPELRAMADELAESMSGTEEQLGAGAMAMWDPRIAAGLVQIAEAIEEIEGTSVRTITTVAIVPTTVEFSRDDLVAWEPESMGSELAGQAGQAVQEAAVSAIRGMFGGRGNRDEEPAEEELRVQPLLRMTSVKSNLVHEGSGASFVGPMYEELASYREIRLADLLEEMQREMQGG